MILVLGGLTALLPSARLQDGNSQNSPVILMRGSEVSSIAARWDVEDTTLAKATPHDPQGGLYTLSGGPDKTILLRFGSLNRVFDSSAKIESAHIKLSIASQGIPLLKRVGIVKKTWGEGPAYTLANTLAASTYKADFGTATWIDAQTAVPNGKWAVPGADSDADSLPVAGAVGNIDPKNPDYFDITLPATLVQTWVDSPGTNYGVALSFSTDSDFNSSENTDGKPELVLTTVSGNTEVPMGIHIDSLTQETNGGFQNWVAVVKNTGKSASKPYHCEWSLNGVQYATSSLPSIAPSQTLKISIPLQENVRLSNPSEERISLTISSEKSPEKSVQKSVYPNGIPIRFQLPLNQAFSEEDAAKLDQIVDNLNEVYFPRSRFSFATEGVTPRIKVVGSGSQGTSLGDGTTQVNLDSQVLGANLTSANISKRIISALGVDDLGGLDFVSFPTTPGIPDLFGGSTTLFPSILGGGDTRYEGSLPGTLSLPEQGFSSSLVGQPMGPLSATEVDQLNHFGGKKPVQSRSLPKHVLLQTFFMDGSPIHNGELTFYSYRNNVLNPTSVLTLGTGTAGSVILPSTESGKSILFEGKPGNPDSVIIKASLNGEVAFSSLKCWQLYDAFARGNTEVALLSARFNLPKQKTDTKTDLAADQSITSSTAAAISDLAQLVSSAPNPVMLTLPSEKGAFFEIDLNRDRPLSEVMLTIDPSHFWKHFVIKTYQTGEQPTDAQIWMTEANLSWTATNLGKVLAPNTVQIPYFGSQRIARFVRIECLDREPEKKIQFEKFSVYAASSP